MYRKLLALIVALGMLMPGHGYAQVIPGSGGEAPGGVETPGGGGETPGDVEEPGDVGGGDEGPGDVEAPGGDEEGPGDVQNPGDSSGDVSDDGQPEAAPEKELKSRLEPMFYLDFDWGRSIINLSGDENTFALGDDSKGYQVTRYRDGEGGIGAKIDFHYDNATGIAAKQWALIGLIPIMGKNIVTVKKVPTLKEAYSFQGYSKMPMHTSEFNSWTAEDSLYVAKRGGVLFMAGGGVGLVGAKVMALAQGTWGVYVEKADDTYVFVQLINNDLKNIGVQAGAIFASVSQTYFRSEEKQLAFLINTKTKNGEMAYQDLIQGSAVLAQKMAEESEGSGQVEPDVIRINSVMERSRGVVTNLFLGLPIIFNYQFEKGRITSFSRTNLYLQKREVAADYAVYNRESRFRFFDHHKNYAENFYGTIYRAKEMGDVNDKGTVGYFGKYNWSYMNDNSTPGSFSRALQKLHDDTGFDVSKIKVPNLRNLEFMSMVVEVNFSEDNTNRLMGLAASGRVMSLKRNLNSDVANYLFDGDQYHLCVNKDGQSVARPECERMLLQRVSYSVDSMQSSLMDMKRYKARGDYKSFAKAYARFGEAFSENPLTFKRGLKLAKDGVLVRFMIQGTHTSYYDANYETTADGTLSSVRSLSLVKKVKQLPPLYSRSPIRGLLAGRGGHQGYQMVSGY